MIRTFCDCCGDEITGANTPASGGKGLGRLTATVKPKPGGSTPFMQVEVMTACGSTWNGGHFCKYCVIDAINKLDDRPQPDNVPRYQLQQSETRYMNLLLDLQRVMDDQPTICNIPEVEQLRARIGGVKGTPPALPRIIQVLAEWEDRNGSLAGIMADEWVALREAVVDAAIVESPRMVRNAFAAGGEAPMAAETLARRFHEAYERLAPQFGYTTRTETRDFDPKSANGRLMVAVCRELLADSAPSITDAARVLAEFAKTAPGRLPQRVQDAIAVATSGVGGTDER